MKRPQFGIRLMLLVVTLLATVFAWKRAVATKNHAEINGRIMALQDKLHALQQERATIYNRWNIPLPIDSLINAAQQELKTLKSDP